MSGEVMLFWAGKKTIKNPLNPPHLCHVPTIVPTVYSKYVDNQGVMTGKFTFCP